jgi:hypothetical protein
MPLPWRRRWQLPRRWRRSRSRKWLPWRWLPCVDSDRLPWRLPWRRRRSFGRLIVKIIAVCPVVVILIKSSPLAQLLGTAMNSVGSNFFRSEPLVSEEGSGDVVLKVDLEAVEDAHVVPLDGLDIVGRMDCLKPVVIDKVVLGGDVAGGEIAN